eukprot:4995366-Prymnesium_polylepis.1
MSSDGCAELQAVRRRESGECSVNATSKSVGLSREPKHTKDKKYVTDEGMNEVKNPPKKECAVER